MGGSGACNSLERTPGIMRILPTQLAGARPTSIGGTIEDGTYVLSADNFWGGAGGWLNETIVITGDTLQILFWGHQAGGDFVVHQTAKLTVAGTNLTITITCSSYPDPAWDVGTVTTVGYSVLGNTLRFLMENNSEERVFTKQ